MFLEECIYVVTLERSAREYGDKNDLRGLLQHLRAL